MRRQLLCLLFHVALVLVYCMASTAAELEPRTVAAFDRYVQLTEQRMTNELPVVFLRFDVLPQDKRDSAYARLRNGEVVTEQLQTLDNGRPLTAPDGLIHHWIGAAFIKGANLKQTLALLQDYDQHAKYYAPDVQRSKLLAQNGDDFKISLRLRKHKIVTVLLNTEYDAKYTTIDAKRSTSWARSTRIAEIRDTNNPDGPEKSVGNDSGYLWRLYSYWRFLERDGGVYVQLEAISLTRSIPTGLGWLVRPFVTSIPQESLAFTLTHTRDALQGR